MRNSVIQSRCQLIYLADACSDRRACLVQMLAVAVGDCLQKLDPRVDRRHCGDVLVDLALGSESQSSPVRVEVQVHWIEIH